MFTGSTVQPTFCRVQFGSVCLSLQPNKYGGHCETNLHIACGARTQTHWMSLDAMLCIFNNIYIVDNIIFIFDICHVYIYNSYTVTLVLLHIFTASGSLRRHGSASPVIRQVVITAEGCRVLTCVPRTVAEIEAVMGGAEWQAVGVSEW